MNKLTNKMDKILNKVVDKYYSVSNGKLENKPIKNTKK